MGVNIDHQFFDSLRAAFQEGDTNPGSKSEEVGNVGQVEQIYRIIARDDFEALGELLADDVIFEIVGSPANPLAGFAQGRQQVIDAARRNFALLEDQRPEVLAVVAQGNTVVVMARERGRFATMGRDYDFHWAQFYTFKEGKVTRVKELIDSGDLVEAAQSKNSLP